MLLRARKRRGARRAQRQLEVIGAPPHDTSRKFLTRVRWVTEYGGIHRSRGYFGLLWDTVWRVLRSPHYSLRESVRALGAIERTQELLLASVNHFDLRTTVRRLEVPIAFFQSRHDVGTNPHVVAHYAAELDAPEGNRVVRGQRSHALLRRVPPLPRSPPPCDNGEFRLRWLDGGHPRKRSRRWGCGGWRRGCSRKFQQPGFSARSKLYSGATRLAYSFGEVCRARLSIAPCRYYTPGQQIGNRKCPSTMRGITGQRDIRQLRKACVDNEGYCNDLTWT